MHPETKTITQNMPCLTMTEKSKLQLCPGSVASYDILQEKECIYSGSQNTCKYLLTYLLSPESTVHDALKLGFVFCPVSRIILHCSSMASHYTPSCPIPGHAISTMLSRSVICIFQPVPRLATPASYRQTVWFPRVFEA